MPLLRSMMAMTVAPAGPTSDVMPSAPRGLAPRMPLIPDNYIKETVGRMDSTPEQSRLNHPGYTHVSSLIGVCTRQYALAARFETQAVERVTGGHRVMWKIGKALEYHVRTQFIKGQGRMGIYGVWRCDCKRVEHLGMFPSRRCATCGGEATNYGEPVLHDDDNMIVGSPDLTFLVGRYFFVPTELKSMNKDDWNALEAPLPDHICQAAMYRYLFQKKNFLVHDNIKFVYTTKDFKFGDPYKEYQIDCTQPSIVATVASMVETARAIKVANESRVLPPRQVCRSQGNSRAKSCPVAHLCFNMASD